MNPSDMNWEMEMSGLDFSHYGTNLEQCAHCTITKKKPATTRSNDRSSYTASMAQASKIDPSSL